MKPSILLVDDDSDMLLLLKRAAERCGLFSLVTYSLDGPNALAVLKNWAGEGRPQIILTDLRMPSMDGVHLIRQLKANPATASLPVAVLSSSSLESDKNSSMQAGAFAYYEKPGSVSQLEKIFRDVLVRNALLEA